MSYIRDYWDEIESGKTIVGYYVHRQMEMLIDDLKNPNLRIDYEEAEKRIRFIEHECRHSEAPFAGKPFILLTFQKAILEAIFAIKIYNDELGRYVRKYQEVLLVMGRKNGKALAIDTPIPTPEGWRTMEELNVGDKVFSVDGSIGEIVTVSSVRFGHQCYKVTFEDGEEITADAEHLWTVKVKKYHGRKNIEITKTTEQMAENFKRIRADGKGNEYRYRVRMQSPVRYTEKDLPLHPYLLGVWLGDGETESPRISEGIQDTEEIVRNIEATGWKANKVKFDRTSMRISITGKDNCLKEKLSAMGLLGNKHIPQEYLQSSVEQRTELLQGLMDTDGFCSKAGQCEISQKSKQLAKNIGELLSSLGIKYTVCKKIPLCNGKECEKAYRITFFADKRRPCFKLKRKLSRLKDSLSDRMDYKSVVDISPVESVPVKCIGINHHSHLYLAGRKFTATHNTPFASALSLSEWVCGELGTKVLYGSNDYDQADLLYTATDAMREASPKLAKCTRRNQKGIFFGGRRQKNHVGKFTSQNKGSIRKLSARTSAKEGRNIKVGIVDEVHELKDDTFIMPIRQALSTQDEPLYIEITTEGFTDNGYLDARLKTAEAVLEGELEKPNMLIFWYTQDSEEEIWRDEKSWYKSNPGMGAVKKWSFLRGMVEDAKNSASTKAFVLAKDFNIKQNSSAAWLTEDVLTNKATFDIEELRGQVFIGGFDFAETTDLCNAKALFVNPWTMQKRTLSMYFIPETKADAILEDTNKLNPEKKNYRDWEKRGLVTICQGTEVNPVDVVRWFVNLTQVLNVLPYKIGFDNWHAKGVKDLIIEAFDEKEMLERIGMDFMSLNGAMSSLETDLMYKKINYNDNEVDRWCLRNTALKLNTMGLKMPVKLYNQSKNRIDGTLGFLISYATYSRYSDTYLQYQKGRIPEGREWA